MNRRDDILSNLTEIKSQIPNYVKLVVVTKTYPISDIEILYEAGLRDFGENRDHEGHEKSKQLPSDVIWHFQGQIQSNKLKSILEWADYIHSLDDLQHAKKMNKLLTTPKSVFVQVSLDGQIGRGGVDPVELDDFIHQIRRMPMIDPIGLMAVAPLNEDPDSSFARLAEIKGKISADYPEIKYLSAGMSGDFKVAIAHGATHVRIGSSILGPRS